MAARVTGDEVRTLLAPYADESDMTLFIEQANMLVDETLVGFGLSDQRLRFVELNLAAHFATLSIERGGFMSQEVGDSKETYSNAATRSKYSATRFGQAAILLDTTGKLQQQDSPLGYAEIRNIGVKPYDGYEVIGS